MKSGKSNAVVKEVIAHKEIEEREGKRGMQKGMHYRPGGKKHSVVLMSVRDDAQYADGFDLKTGNLLYEGEDIKAGHYGNKNPKAVDQPLFTKSGLSNNGRFLRAVELFKMGATSNAERVRVYEKIARNKWADPGWFHLIDAERRHSKRERRNVWRFTL